MIKLLKTIIIFMCSSSNLHALENEKVDYLSLDKAIETALENNPKIDVVQAKYKALTTVTEQVGILPEPRLMLNAVNLPMDSFSLDQTPMTQIQVGISQAIPYPGKLSIKKEIAEKNALVSKVDIANTSQWLTLQVKHSWWHLFYLDRSLETVASNLELLSEFIDVTETKYTVGQGLQQDVLLAHVELAKLEDSQLTLMAMRQKKQALLNALLNRDTATIIALDKSISTELPETLKLEELIKKSQTERPEIQQAMLMISASKKQIVLAEKEYYPDFKLGAIYGWRQNETGLASLQFSMNLPFNTEKRQDKLKDQRQQEWMQKKYELETLKNDVAEEVHRALADYQQSRKQVSIYQDRIIPQANQTVESMMAGYQVNKVDFLNLLRSQLNLFNFQTQYWQAISSANRSLAALEYAVGDKNIYEQ